MNSFKDAKALLIVYSYHHNNTLKIAEVLSSVLHAEIKTPEDINDVLLNDYDLIGFGSGIDSGKHYPSLLNLANQLETVSGKSCFIDSTSAVQGKIKVFNDHSTLRNILLSKGYKILDEFSCKGFNTNSFLKYFGGMNKGRPDTDDLHHAKTFANRILQDYMFNNL